MGISLTYAILAAVRVAVTLLPQTGYIHPDEFFQSAEIVAGDIFHGNVHLPWEFNSSAPIRNIAIPYITCGIPFIILKTLDWLLSSATGYSLITTYTLLVAPRLWMTLISFVTDFLVWKTCCTVSTDPLPRLFVFASSYVTLTYSIRTSSNAVESVFFAALLYYVAKAVVVPEVKRSNTAKGAEQHNLSQRYKLPIATILSFGFFNRPTFVIYALTPIAFWLQFNHPTRKGRFLTVIKRFVSLMPTFYIVSTCLVLCDTLYYRLTIDDIASFNFMNDDFKFVCTPCNFILYNTNPANLELHGTHPRWLHLLVNIPLLFGMLGVTGLFSYWFTFWFQLIKLRKSKLIIRPIAGLLISSYTLPVLLLSIFSHQEPRFLIPILFPLALAHGSDVWGKKWYSLSRIAWLFFNASLLFFYGFLHQGGVVPSSQYLTRLPEVANTHAIYFHTYMPPRHLTTIPTKSRITIHDLGGEEKTHLRNVITRIIASQRGGASIFLISPTTMRKSLINFSPKWKIELIHNFPLHLSTEEFPEIQWSLLFTDAKSAINKLKLQLGLDLYKISEMALLM